MSHKAYEIQLTDHCSILQQFFHQFKADDIDVYVKDSHIIAVDGYGNQWKDAEVYDFVQTNAWHGIQPAT